MLKDVIWVAAVMVFWLLVATLMFFFVRTISAGRDDDETVCELTEKMSGDHLMPTQ